VIGLRGEIMKTILAVLFVLVAASAAFAGPLDAPGATKALTCSACHGVAGQSPSSSMPIIAGISPAYFKKAIDDYATGKRPSPEMEPYAKMVRDLGVDEVGAFFAAQTRQPTAVPADPAAAARGRAAAAQCAICHGPDGRGDAAKVVPDLRGQPAAYLQQQMLAFKADKRSPGDANLQAVKALMKGIPDNTLADLAAYFSSVR
jgi:cytochrome c553